LPGSTAAVVAPMPGVLVRYLVRPGDAVKLGQPVVIVEAMKMQNSLSAGRSGRVASLGAKEGDNVGKGQVLVTVEDS
jgi:biotin carboxyl carrier protein